LRGLRKMSNEIWNTIRILLNNIELVDQKKNINFKYLMVINFTFHYLFN
jgi:hypothetical protein